MLSVANGQQISRSPSQKLADALLEKYHAKMFLPVVSKFMPGLDLAGALGEIDDPVKWHNALLHMNKILSKALMEDHEGGFVSDDECTGLKYYDSLAQAYAETTGDRSISITESSEDGRISGGSESISSGDDGQREINPDVSSDGQVYQSVQPAENTSQSSDSGHETPLQGHVGAKWPDDLDDW